MLVSGDLLTDLVAKNSAFSTATLIYTRLRRVTGRVVDAAYLAENIEYAKHVSVLIQVTGDAELLKYIEKLNSALGIENEALESETSLEEKTKNIDAQSELEPSYEATEEEIYKAQVSHHYIGALR